MAWKRKSVTPVEPPEILKEQVETAWKESPLLQEFDAEIEKLEHRIKDWESKIKQLQEEYDKACYEAAGGIREARKKFREEKIELNRTKAKRNTQKNKIYKKIEEHYIRGVRAGIGIKQTWADPEFKRSIQRLGLGRCKKGKDVGTL